MNPFDWLKEHSPLFRGEGLPPDQWADAPGIVTSQVAQGVARSIGLTVFLKWALVLGLVLLAGWLLLKGGKLLPVGG